MGFLQAKQRKGCAMLTLNKLVLLLGFLKICAILEKIDQEMRPQECAQMDVQRERQSDAN